MKATPRDLGLKSDSFSATEPVLLERGLVSVEGLEGSGKTSWALRGLPDPIVVFNFDQGLKGIIEQFPKKTIIPAGVPLRKGQSGYPSYYYSRPPATGNGFKSEEFMKTVRKEAGQVWDKFQADYDEFLTSRARSCVVDTGGAVYQLGRFAMIGIDKPGQDTDPYGKLGGQLNSIFQQLITKALSYDKHVVWVHRLKQVWNSDPPMYEAEGYKGTNYEFPYVFRLIRGKAKEPSTLRVMKARVPGGMKMVGEVFAEKEMRYSYVMAALTRTDEEAWR